MAEEPKSNRLSSGLWPALTYRYVEHYFWEPQHLRPHSKSAVTKTSFASANSPFADFKQKLKSQETPLNYLLNIFLRLCSQSAKQSLLTAFGLDANSNLFSRLDLCFPEDRPFVQPDVVLESPLARVCIEVKVEAKTKIEQVQKYCFLQAHLNAGLNLPKHPVLLYLTQKEFATHWVPVADIKKQSSSSSSEFLKQILREQPLASKVEGHTSAIKYREAYQDIVDRIEFGFATWQQFGSVVNSLMQLKTIEGGEAAEMFGALAGDFLLELQERHLWTPEENTGAGNVSTT